MVTLATLVSALALFAAEPQFKMHRRAVVIDTHADTTQAIVYGGADIARPGGSTDLDLAKAAAGGLDAAVLLDLRAAVPVQARRLL